LKIRTKLFIFIPIIVLLLNLVSFFIFQSGKKIQESYNLMIDRIYIYKQISNETDKNLRYLSSYVIYQDAKNYRLLIEHKEKLKELKKELLKQSVKKNNELNIENYYYTLDSFLEEEDSITNSLIQKNYTNYVDQYKEVEKIASFIKEDSQNLVDIELNNYYPIYNNVVKNMNSMNKLGVMLFIITTIMSIVFAIWLSRSIILPINKLIYMAKQIGKGNFEVGPFITATKDEVSILGEIFNEMQDNLKILMSKNLEIVEKDRLVKELELKALQSQINPHFLFNTLNVISKLAYIEGAEQTSDLTISTSNLLRYNLRKLDEAVSISDEIMNAKEYFSIQKARFRDRVRFELDVDEECLDQLIPCLTIQPLLENAFIHGIEHMENNAVIGLAIKKHHHKFVINVYDNGKGMSEEIKLSLLDTSDYLQGKTKSTGLGTTNVFKRLKLYYGKENIVGIESKINEGTKIILTIPFTSMETKGGF
jgi:sensor histidine kinase YesM